MTPDELTKLLTRPTRVVQIRPVSYREWLASSNPSEDFRLTGGLDVVLWADEPLDNQPNPTDTQVDEGLGSDSWVAQAGSAPDS